jgi:hypothetical protein
MKIPILEPPDGIEEVLNMDAVAVGSIDDMDLASSMQYKIAQFIAYVAQQYRIVNSAYNERNDYFIDNWNRLATNVAGKMSLTEKKAIALEQSERLKTVKKEVDELRMQKELLEGWADHLQNLYDVLKQMHYRLRLRDFGG